MKEIIASAKSVRDLLSGRKYQIDYYQREYRWEQKQVFEMIDDLVAEFFEDFQPSHAIGQVERYGNYFLGSIIISQRNHQSFVVDGQQRLTTLTLILIYLHQISNGLSSIPPVADLIYSEKFGVKSFNLQVPEREAALTSLFNGEEPTEALESESVANLIARYTDIGERFPYRMTEENPESEPITEPQQRGLDDTSLPHFMNWLIEKVFLVEITSTSDDDAYTIFETMNDRGLSLTPTDMLKGFLLANITDEHKKIRANDVWREIVADLNRDEREGSSDFIKAWLRSQYANTIRTSQGKVQHYDFDRIGSEFHRWVRDQSEMLKLRSSDDYFDFIVREMRFFAEQYQLILRASSATIAGLEHIRYNAHRGFTLQPMFLLAPIRMGDSPDLIHQKFRLGAVYLDILLAWKDWNYRRIGQSMMKTPIFNDLKFVRSKTTPDDQARALYDLLHRDQDTFDSNDRFVMTKMNGGTIHRVLARLTAHIDKESGKTLDWETLVSDKIKNRYQIEHIWANKYDRHSDEFSHEADFRAHRDRLGDLVLIPSDINQSFRDKVYSGKLAHYTKQNMLVASLSERAYEHEPGFLGFVRRSGLNFKPYEDFKRSDIDERQELYADIAKQIWNPQRLLDEVPAWPHSW